MEEKEENNQYVNPAIIGLVLIGIIISYFFKRDSWQGFFYPNLDNYDKVVTSQPVKSLDDCRDWVNEQIYIYHKEEGEYDYECGKGCRYEEKYKTTVCKTTEQ